MNCPRCHQPAYQPTKSCKNCHFQGDPALVEELDRIRWLLAEMSSWQGFQLGPSDLTSLQSRYQTRHDELEYALALRLPPFTAAEAAKVWPLFIQQVRLSDQLTRWCEANQVDPIPAGQLIDQTRRQVETMQGRLNNRTRPDYPQTPAEHLVVIEFLLMAVRSLARAEAFTSPEAEKTIRAELLAEQTKWEKRLSPQPEAVAEPSSTMTAEPIATEIVDESGSAGR
jgi:hypothetical protein